VLVTDGVKGKRTETIMRHGVTDEMINNPSIMVLGVLTRTCFTVTICQYDSLDENALVKATQRENSGVLSGTTTIIF
jgi:hypothetical protein